MRRNVALSFLLVVGFHAVALGQPPIDPEQATEAYLATVPAEERERSDAYFEGGYWLQLVGYLYGLGIAWVLLASRLSARMRDEAEGRRGRGFIGSALYVAPYTVATFLLGFL